MADLSSLLSGSYRPSTTTSTRTRPASSGLPDYLTRAQSLSSAARTVENDPRLARMAEILRGLSQDRPAPAPRAPMSVPGQGGGGNRQGGPPSMIGQFGNMMSAIPAGVASLTGMAAQTIAALPRAAVDVATGNADEVSRKYNPGGGFRQSDVFDMDMVSPKLQEYIDEQGYQTKQGGFRGLFAHYAPLPAMMAESGARTVDFAEDVTRGDFSKVREASGEGRTLDFWLENIGNAAIVGGLASKALGTVGKEVSVSSQAARAIRGGETPARSVGAAAASSVRRSPLNDLTAATRAIDPTTGAVIPFKEVVKLPSTGLAKILEETGHAGAASATSAVSRGLRRGYIIGETVDDVQLSLIPRLAYKGTKKIAGPQAKKFGKWAETYNRAHEGRLADMLGTFGTESRQAHRMKRKLEGDLQGASLPATRALLEADNIAVEAGITPSMGRAVLFDVDNRFTSLVNTYRSMMAHGVDDAAINRVIERDFAGEASTNRLTIDDVRVYDDWKSGRLDDTQSGAMREIESVVRAASERLTEQYVTAGVIGEGDLSQAPVPEYVAKFREDVELRRDTELRDLEAATRAAAPTRTLADTLAGTRQGVRTVVQPDPIPRVRPEVDLSSIQKAKSFKDAAKAIRAKEADKARAYAEGMTGGSKPIMTGLWEDYGKIRSQERIKQYASEGFLSTKVDPTLAERLADRIAATSDPVLREQLRNQLDRLDYSGVPPDVFAEQVGAMTGRPGLDTVEALELYFGAIDNYLDARSTTSSATINRLANETGYSPDAIEVALTRPAAEFKDYVIEEGRNAIEGTKAVFDEMDPTTRKYIIDELRSMREQGLPVDEIADYMNEVVKAFGPDGQLLEGVWNRVPFEDLAEYVQGDIIPDKVYETVGTRPLVREEAVMADRAKGKVNDLVRRRQNVNRHNRTIAEIPNELNKTFTTKLRVDINQPAMRRWTNSIRTLARPFGRLELGSADVDPNVTGVMGDVARRNGIHDQLVGALADEIKHAEGGYMPENSLRALSRVLADEGIELSTADRLMVERSFQTDQMIAEIRQTIADSDPKDSNLPFRVMDQIRSMRTDVRFKHLSDDVLSKVESQFDRYKRQRSAHLLNKTDLVAATMPGKYRAVGANNRNLIRSLLEEAEQFRLDGDPHTSEIMMLIAEDIPTTMQQMVAAGIDPDYLTGGTPTTIARNTAGGGITKRPLRAEHRLTEGTRPVDLGNVVQLTIQQADQFLINNAATWISNNMSRPVSSIIGDVNAQWLKDHPSDVVMPEADMRQALRDAGWEQYEKGPLTLASPVIPHTIVRDLKRMSQEPGRVWKFFNTTNGILKTSVLPLSPNWLTGNVVGNAYMAMFNYGMGPAELARLVDEIQKMEGGWKQLRRQGGLPSWAPDELGTHGLTFAEHRMRWGQVDLMDALDPDASRATRAKAKVDRFIGGSYNLNEFVDNIGRSAVYLKELRKTGNEALATKAALRAMGDFTRMTPFERRWARQIFPFYTWMRHQTVAAMRLPLESPARAAWLYHLTSMTQDPEFGDDMLQLLGSRVPLSGDNFLNIGGLSPFGDLTQLPLDPTSNEVTRSLSPAVKLPSELLGYDLGKGAVSRPYGDQALGPFGNVVPKSALRRSPQNALGEVLYRTTGALPQTKAARNLVLGPLSGNPLGEFRYSSGDRGPTQYDKPDTGLFGETSLLTELLKGGRLPRIDQMDLKQMLREQAEREAQARRRSGG